MKKSLTPFFFILPSLVWICFVQILPIIQSFYNSLFILDPRRPKTFIGFGNYFRLLTAPEFYHSVSVTLYFTSISIGIQIVLGIIIALSLNEEIKFRGTFRAIILVVPWAVTRVVNALMWKWIFNSTVGALNGLLFQLGLIHSYINWLGETFSALTVAAFISAWAGTPFLALSFLAAMQAVPSDVYDAAKVDGAGPWQRFKNVTLPLIRPVMVIVLVMKSVWTFREIDTIYILTEGGPSGGTEILGYHAYRRIWEYMDFGYGAALSYIITLISLGLAVLYIKLLYKEI